MNDKDPSIEKDLMPPYRKNHKGDERRVGFEIEYIGISIMKSCDILKKLFSGTIERLNDNEFLLKNASLGEFKVERDARLLKKMASKSEKNIQNEKIDFEGWIQKALSSALKRVVPLEIVSPPVLIGEIELLDRIIPELRQRGASGTKSSKLAAFGVHINPDTPSLKSECILAYLQAYVLLSDWLRKEIKIDATRLASFYINEYPAKYKRKILHADYKPDITTLMDDYLQFNPTRNRSLDMLPLFSYMDEDKILGRVSSPLIKSRPTFHYRLANTSLNNPYWNFTTEWKRWLYVEKLAANPEVRAKMAQDYLEQTRTRPLFPNTKKWIKITTNFLKHI